MNSNEVFADCFNYKLYGGKKVISPEALHPLDSESLLVLFEEKENPDMVNGGKTPRIKSVLPVALGLQRKRDIYKYVSAFTDDSAVYLILGLEIQDEVHYAMPVRAMVYNAIGYADQVKALADKNRKNRGRNGQKLKSSEFLSGIKKEDRLKPIITVVLFLKPDKWDGPRDLYDMLAPYDENIRPYINNFRINLISPEELGDDEFEKFNTELGKVIEFIKCSGSKEKLKQMTEKYNEKLVLSREAAVFINEVTNAKLAVEEDEEEIEVCKAIDDMCEESMKQGRADGITEGRNDGENAMAALYLKLEADGRIKDFTQAVNNEAARRELYKEYGIIYA